MKTSIYRYFSDRKWAEEFLLGSIRFGPLTYYQSIEDENRRDGSEGILRHNHGETLRITNLTQGREMELDGYSFQSKAKADDIYVLSFSRSLNRDL